MGVRENKVETYLDKEVTKLGGLTYKWVSPGRDGVPDRIIIYKGNVYFVEVKTKEGKISPQQTREISRITLHGADTYILFGHEQVDWFVNTIKND